MTTEEKPIELSTRSPQSNTEGGQSGRILLAKEEVTVATQEYSPSDGSRTKCGVAFWMTFVSLCTSLSLFSLELTSVSTALPTIVSDLTLPNFVWVGSSYALASTACVPLTGNFAQVFGRKPTLVGAVLMFALGSALCGAAHSNNMMLSGRTIQGFGGGSIVALTGILLGDLVSLKERGLFFGLLGLTWSVACVIGPIVGGGLASAGAWRWLFYLNLPICGICIVIFYFFLHLRSPRDGFIAKLKRIDYIGNLLVIGSSIAIALALTWGGVQHSWGSGSVLSPLIIGIVGLVVFIIYEKKWATDPVLPFILISNRTSASGYLQNLLLPVVAIAATYFIPIYYQACKGSSPLKSGVETLGLAIIAPASIIAGINVVASQKYRPGLWLGWTLATVGASLMTTVHANTSTGRVVGYTIIVGVGAGFVYATAQFPVQAPLPVSQNGPAMALCSFVRAFASIWGVTLGNAVLQNELLHHLPSSFTSQFPEGIPLVYTIIPRISFLPQPVRDSVRDAFAEGLQLMWKILTGVAGLGLLVSLAMAEIPLAAVTDENWGLDEKEKAKIVNLGT
ncbi:MFS general substrate transporter [Cyathus striatus]|nr:MFS general substrate transporter [Cyathus striatus]